VLLATGDGRNKDITISLLVAEVFGTDADHEVAVEHRAAEAA
jgi:hypothetical protein